MSYSRQRRPSNGQGYVLAMCGVCSFPDGHPPTTGIGDGTYPNKKVFASFNPGFLPWNSGSFTRSHLPGATSSAGGPHGWDGWPGIASGGDINFGSDAPVTNAFTDTYYAKKTETWNSFGLWGAGTKTVVTGKYPFSVISNGAVVSNPANGAVTTGAIPATNNTSLAASVQVQFPDFGPYVPGGSTGTIRGDQFTLPETEWIYTRYTANWTATALTETWVVVEAAYFQCYLNPYYENFLFTAVNTAISADRILQTVTKTTVLSEPFSASTTGLALLSQIDLYDEQIYCAVYDQPQVNLNWRPVTGASGYKVKRATQIGGPFTVIATPGSNSFSDTTVAQGMTYFYVVSAVVSGSESVNSAAMQVTPSVPANPFSYLVADALPTAGPATASGAPQMLQLQAANPQFQIGAAFTGLTNASTLISIQGFGSGVSPDGWLLSVSITEPVLSGHSSTTGWFLARNNPVDCTFGKSLVFLQNTGSSPGGPGFTRQNPTQGKFYLSTAAGVTDVTGLFLALTFPNLINATDGLWLTNQIEYNPASVPNLGDLFYGT